MPVSEFTDMMIMHVNNSNISNISECCVYCLGPLYAVHIVSWRCKLAFTSLTFISKLNFTLMSWVLEYCMKVWLLEAVGCQDL